MTDSIILRRRIRRHHLRHAGARDPRAAAEHADKLGVVIGGSLSEGLAVKLDRDISLEELAVGRYVVARGRRARSSA